MWSRASNAKERTLGRTLLVYVLRDLQNAELRFEHEFFLLAQWLLLVKQACNLIERVMCTTACLGLLRRWRSTQRSIARTSLLLLPIFRSLLVPQELRDLVQLAMLRFARLALLLCRHHNLHSEGWSLSC